jgi:hypothetical protein
MVFKAEGVAQAVLLEGTRTQVQLVSQERLFLSWWNVSDQENADDFVVHVIRS